MKFSKENVLSFVVGVFSGAMLLKIFSNSKKNTTENFSNAVGVIINKITPRILRYKVKPKSNNERITFTIQPSGDLQGNPTPYLLLTLNTGDIVKGFPKIIHFQNSPNVDRNVIELSDYHVASDLRPIYVYANKLELI